MVKINLPNFVIRKSKFSFSRELSRYLNRIIYINNKLTKLESDYYNFDEYLSRLPKQLNELNGFFLTANLKLVVRMAVLLVLLLTPKKLEKHKSVSLIYGLSQEQIYFAGSTTKLKEFLLSQKIGLAETDLFYIENSRHRIVSNRSEKILITGNIPTILFHDFLNFGDKLQIIFLVSQRFLKYLATLIKHPIVKCIAQAYVIDEVIYDYLIKNRKIKIIDLIATQSIITHIPYIFERDLQLGKRIMIWYSSNSVPIIYRDKDLERFRVSEKIYEFMPLDFHYVWNQSHKDYLDYVIKPPIPVEVRGSLMFYLPQEEINFDKVYDIVIFDITPYESSFKSNFEKISFSQNSIYSCYFAIKFLQEILWAKNEIERSFGIKLRIALKPKRKYTPLHSRDYLAFLDNSSKTGSIEILEPELDLYKTISKSRMSICYPFTSPAIIAKELEIPTAYFLSGNSIESNSIVDGIEFITDRTKLLDFIIKYRIFEQ